MPAIKPHVGAGHARDQAPMWERATPATTTRNPASTRASAAAGSLRGACAAMGSTHRVERVRRGERIVRTNAPMDFAGLDMLNLTLGKGTWTDLRHSGTPREFNLGIRNEVVQDVKDSKELVAKLTPIFVRAGLAFFGVGQPVPSVAPTNQPPSVPKLNEAAVPKP